MIYFLKGIVEHIADDFLVVDVNGVGYQAYCSSRTLAALAEGEVTKLSIFTNVKETELSLFGFRDEAERAVFEKLTSVSGVGPKVGLAILTVLTPDEAINAVTLQDHTSFARASGVGPKLAQRIVMELKGKMGSLPTGVTGARVEMPATAGLVGDVLSALSNLGYKPQQAQQALAHVSQENPDADFDALFKGALAELR